MADLDNLDRSLDEVTSHLEKVKASKVPSAEESALIRLVQSKLDNAKKALDHVVAATAVLPAAETTETLHDIRLRLFGTTAIYLFVFTSVMVAVFALSMWSFTTKFTPDADKLTAAHFNASVALVYSDVLHLEVSDSFSKDQAEDIISRLDALFYETQADETHADERRHLLTVITTIAANNFAQAGRVDLVERLYVAAGSPVYEEFFWNELFWVPIFVILGNQGILAGASWPEEYLYEDYKKRIPSYPELHILYDALIAQAKQSPTEDILQRTMDLNDADKSSFVQQMSRLLTGDSGLPTEETSQLTRVVCELLQANEGSDFDLLDIVYADAPSHCLR